MKIFFYYFIKNYRKYFLIFKKYNFCFHKRREKMEKNQNKLSRAEQEKLDSFLTMKIEEAFNLFSKEKGYIDNEFFYHKFLL